MKNTSLELGGGTDGVLAFRQRILNLLGRAPAEEPLRCVVEERAELGDHIRMKVSYQVELDERVTAYLLVPSSGPAPYPAVLALH